MLIEPFWGDLTKADPHPGAPMQVLMRGLVPPKTNDFPHRKETSLNNQWAGLLIRGLALPLTRTKSARSKWCATRSKGSPSQSDSRALDFCEPTVNPCLWGGLTFSQLLGHLNVFLHKTKRRANEPVHKTQHARKQIATKQGTGAAQNAHKQMIRKR